MTKTYVRVNRGKHRGAIGLLRMAYRYEGVFRVTIEFPNKDSQQYCHAKRKSYIVFPDTSQKQAAKMFKYAQRLNTVKT